MGSIPALRWQQSGDGEASAAYTFAGEQHETPVVQTASGDNTLLLLGVPFGVAVDWSVAITVDGVVHTAEGSIQTEPLPDSVPQPTDLFSDPSALDAQSRYVLTTTNTPRSVQTGAIWTFIMDRQGRVVWAMETPPQRATLHARRSADGTDILIDHNSFWGVFDGGEESVVIRVGIDGVVQETIATQHLHHPFIELPDGSLVWGASSSFSADETLRVRRPDGRIEDLWSCAALLESLGVEDTCGSNTIFYSEADDTFLFSLYSVETVIEIDHATGQTLNTFGHLPGSWSFSPEDAAFWWQHGPVITEEGTLLISSKVSESGTETVVREYALDASAQTLTEVWSFGIGEGVYGSEMGEAHRLPGGNTLHNYGTTARLREVTPDGEVVWDVTWGDSTFIGRSEVISDLYALWP